MSEQKTSVPYGYCHCGCGGRTEAVTQTKVAKGLVKGEPHRFIDGHQRRDTQRESKIRAARRRWAEQGVPYGVCLCGCGRTTNIASRTNGTRGHVRGEPYPYLVGHQRKTNRYVAEDRGFETPCWIWQMWTGGNGYGYLKRGGRQLLAHRVAYAEAHGAISAGLVLHHRCGQPLCVNPAHLEPMTQSDHQKLHRAGP